MVADDSSKHLERRREYPSIEVSVKVEVQRGKAGADEPLLDLGVVQVDSECPQYPWT